MTEFIENTGKISLILLVGLAATASLRHRAAAFRHWVLAVTLGCAAALPLIESIAPSWRISVPTRLASSPQGLSTRPVDSSQPQVSASIRLDDSAGVTLDSSAFMALLTPRNIFTAGWVTGICLSLSILFVGAMRLTRIASRSRRIRRGSWVAMADELARTYQLRRNVVLLQSADARLLVTWGFLQAKVILPPSASAWPEDRVRLVLAHELAHARRNDWIVQLAAELLRSIYWFNPLIWMACARLRQESEHACDDAVLDRGVDGSAYAAHLVAIARELTEHRMWMPAPAIARTTSLERRIQAMLDARQDRQPLSRVAGIATFVALLALTIPIAGFASAQATFSSISGSIVDPTNAALPAVKVVLTNVETRAKYEVQSDQTGRYEFVGLPPGDYRLETQLAGFAPLQRTITVAAQNVQHDLVLDIGTLQETVSVVGGPTDADAPTPVVLDPDAQRVLEEKRRKREATRCPGNANADSSRIGGNLRAPMKIKDVRPAYPSSLRGTGLAGTVVLQGRIGVDGILEDLETVSAPHPDFVVAAREAVGQWQFDQTLLNCMPMEVTITVTVNFSYQP